MNEDIEHRSFWGLPPGRNESDLQYWWEWDKDRWVLRAKAGIWQMPYNGPENAGTLKFECQK